VWATTDGGATWVEQGKGAGSLPLKMLPLGILMDPGDPERFWTWGNWTSGNTGILQTTDGGRTLASAHAYEAEGLSVDFGDPMRRTMVYGQHEATRSVFRSGNGGQTWTQIGKTLPADSAMSEFPLVVDDHTFLIGCSFMTFGTPPPRGTAGIFRTADSGATWTRVAPQAVFRSPLVVDGTIYWSYYNVETKDGGLVRSDDHGATWKVVTASGLKYRQIPMALPDGRIATLRANNALVISTDGGATWAEARPAPTMKPVSGATFNDVLGAFFVWEGAGHAQRVDLGP
jgi:photosystem II stability/assembly factor-like uncharacterized protein